jgi:hypothetical protein
MEGGRVFESFTEHNAEDRIVNYEAKGSYTMRRKRG